VFLTAIGSSTIFVDMAGETPRWTALVLGLALAAACSASSAQDDRPVIDPAVRAAIGAGPQRVLVELRVVSTDASALTSAQDEVMRGLTGTGARLARRYMAAPLLALEVDAAALARLEEMRTLVKRVTADRIVQPNEDSAPRR
jgi:hypothetical protein